MQQKPYKHIDIPHDIHIRLVRRKAEFEPIHNVIKRLLDMADACGRPGPPSISESKP